MKVYYCDICGEEFDPHRGGQRGENGPTAPGLFGEAQRGMDICTRCLQIGEKRVDFRGVMAEAWRKAVEEAHDA